MGLGQLQLILDKILDMDREASMDDLNLLQSTAEAISVSADCAIGTEAAKMVLRGINGYREDFESHIINHTCSETIRSHAPVSYTHLYRNYKSKVRRSLRHSGKGRSLSYGQLVHIF